MSVTSSLTSAELFAELYAWIKGVAGDGVEVIQSHQDAPAPSGHYLAIEYEGSWSKVGGTSHMARSAPALPSPNVHLYEGQVQVWEVDGLGDILRDIVESVDRMAAAFESRGFSVLRAEGPTAMPTLDGDRHWRREHVLTIHMLWARGDEGTTEYIETADIQQVTPEE